VSGLARRRGALVLLASAVCIAALLWIVLRPQPPRIAPADGPLVRRATADRARAYKSFHASLPQAAAWRVFRREGATCAESRSESRSRDLAYLACYDTASGALVEERIGERP
jgi:hypothetical protein